MTEPTPRKHKIFGYSGQWYGCCGKCTNCESGDKQQVAWFKLEKHVLQKHPLTPASSVR